MEDFGWPLGFVLPNLTSNNTKEFDNFNPNPSAAAAAAAFNKHRRSLSDTPALIKTSTIDQDSSARIDVSPLPPGLENVSNQDIDCVAGNQTLDDDSVFDSSLDPKRARRIIANRQSAQRSRIRKLQYIAELEKSVSSLQMEVSTLTPQVSFLDHQRVLLNVDNSVMKQRIAALVQNVRLKDAHNEALRKEAESLRQLFQQQQHFGIQGFVASNPQDHSSSSSSSNGETIVLSDSAAAVPGNFTTTISPHLSSILSGGTKHDRPNDACYNHSLLPDFAAVAPTAGAPLSLSLKF